jgi:hypothetical protein
MKIWLIAAALAAFSTAAQAQYYGGYGTGSNSQSHGVSGYTRSNGTYVQPYQATNPNSTQRDNYGTSGNYNPYTGHTGRRGAQY